jgi:hypothetical protein
MAINNGSPTHLVDAFFDEHPNFEDSGATERAEYIERALRVGFPETTKHEGQRRDRFF